MIYSPGDGNHTPQQPSERPGFQPPDEPLELPAQVPTGEERGLQRGPVANKLGLTHTHRMLIGMLAEGMAKRGINQAELSLLTGLSAPYVSQLVSGERTGSFAAWDKVLSAVQCDYAGLGTFTPRPKPAVKRGRKPKGQLP